MELIENDVHICRVLFNKDTHAMAIALYGERAKELYEYIRKEITNNDDFFKNRMGYTLEYILRKEPLASFFFDNNFMDFSCCNGFDIACILVWSSICEKIWESEKLDPYLYKLNSDEICYVLEKSPIKEKIEKSGKLKL